MLFNETLGTHLLHTHGAQFAEEAFRMTCTKHFTTSSAFHFFASVECTAIIVNHANIISDMVALSLFLKGERRTFLLHMTV